MKSHSPTSQCHSDGLEESILAAILAYIQYHFSVSEQVRFLRPEASGK